MKARAFLTEVKDNENGTRIRFKYEETNYWQDYKYKYFESWEEAREYCIENDIIIIE